MKELLLTLFLVSTLAQPSDREFPFDAYQVMAANLSEVNKQRFIQRACELGLFFAEKEEAAWDSFDGVYIVIWRRAQGRPFPYPTDPLFGKRPPGN